MSVWTVEEAIPEDIKAEIAKIPASGSKTVRFLRFLNIIKRLKTTMRTGWLNFGVNDAESIADHMYRMGIISFMAESGVDSNRCVKMALVHDMAESLTGDITPEDPVSKEEKHRRELEAITYLRDLLKPFNSDVADEMYELWNEYENVSTKEARFVKDVDKFELMVQCLEEEKRYAKKKDLGVFMGVRSQIKTSMVSEWADEVLREREAYWSQ
ncbi:5'-deoxynucleotidase Ygk1p [Trichomonascus vanleenenianus]|uniref:HD domain-containing protein n=1 Tax=Trichomonascus vanleenenianus TaxID=2268995 RepID=UPI003ECBA601